METIKCEKCGAPIDANELKGLQCPYCGSKIQKVIESKEGSNRKSYQFGGIVPFSRSEEEARQTLAWHLADEKEVPIDVFNHLDIKVKKVFVPLWDFEGSFKSPWSCQKVVTRRREYKEDGKTKYEYYDEYYPANGVAVGNFSLFVSGNKKTYGNIPHVKSIAFSPELIDSDATVKELEISREDACRSEKVKSHIEHLVNKELRKSLPKSYEDLNSYYEYYFNRHACVLYPIYEVEFDYDSETYDNLVSGYTDCLIESLNAPRQETISHEEDHDLMEVNDSSLVWSMVAWGVVFLILGVILVFKSGAHGHTLGFVSSVLLAILGLAFPIITYSRIEDEKSLRNRIINDREKHDKEIRFQQLINEPLLQPYREKMEVTGALIIDSDTYNKKVRTDKSSNTKFKLILIVLFTVSVGIYVASGMAKSAKEYAEQVSSENRMERIRNIYNRITPQLFFLNDKDKTGHLRQDIRETLTDLGFIREDEHRSEVASLSTAEVYSLYLDGEDNPIMQIVLNNKSQGFKENPHEICDVCIKIPILTLADEYISAFTDKITQNGFVVASDINIKPTSPYGTSLPILINSDSYIRIGKTVRKQDFFGEELYFNYDVVEFKKGYSEAEIVCYSHADKNINTTEVEETVEPIVTDSVVSDREYSNRDDAAVDRMVETAPAE